MISKEVAGGLLFIPEHGRGNQLRDFLHMLFCLTILTDRGLSHPAQPFNYTWRFRFSVYSAIRANCLGMSID